MSGRHRWWVVGYHSGPDCESPGTNGDERGQIPGNPRYRGVYTAAAGLRPEPAARVDAAGRAAGHPELHAAVGEIDSGGSEGGASRVLQDGHMILVRAQGGRV